MDRPSFERLVTSALNRLPKKFKNKLENIAVQIEDSPSADVLSEMDIDSGTLFGLYQGVPLTERGWSYGNVLPDRITIYQKPIEDASRSKQDIEELVLEVVMHEIGHYFGFDDRALSKLESEKRRKNR